MPPRRSSRPPNSGRAGLVFGILLCKAGVASSFRGCLVQRARYVRRQPGEERCTRWEHLRKDMRLSATRGDGGAGDIDSSELYADMRRRLEELRRSGAEESTPAAAQDVSDLGLFQQQDGRGDSDLPGGGGDAGAAGAKMYSAQEMKQRYYEAFWRARNLHKEARFEGTSDSSIREDSPDASSPPATPPPEAQAQAAASRTTTLTPMAMNMFLSGKAAAKADPVAPSSSSSEDVQGLTQMYYLVEEEEAAAATATATAAAAVPCRAPEASAAGVGRTAAPLSLGKKREWQQSSQQAGAALPKHHQAAFSSSGEEAVAGDLGFFSGGSVTSMSAEPQGLTQVFYLDPEEEAEAAAALPVVPRRSFLRERLGVPGEVVQGLRQVELDHARLAMIAVLMSGAVGAGAGAGAGVYLNAHDGFSALAEVARTPWLDPYVAGGILAAKALSEGDWRIGKGALAGWADRALSSLSNTGAKVLRVGSGNELRRLAVEIEVKHGRMALGAVVCAMAQQGILTVAA